MLRLGWILILAIPGCASVPDPAPTPTPARFDYEFLNFVAGAKPSVMVKIRKDDPDYGPVMWSGVHHPGDTLGWSTEWGTLSSTHLVLSARKGKAVYVDFDTGVLIERIAVNQIVATKVKRCPIIWKPMPVCPGPKETSDVYRVNEVLCLERTGVKFTHQAGTFPTIGEDLCTAHGGRGVPQWNQEKAKEDWGSQVASHLFDADNGWRSRNPKTRLKARDTYRRLVKEFPTIELVEKNWDRIKSRSEAEIEE